MAAMNISVPEAMHDWVQSRIQSGHYSSVSAYVQDLIRRDQEAGDPQLTVEDIRRTIEEARVKARTASAADVFTRIEEKVRGLVG